LGCLWWYEGTIRFGGFTVLDWTYVAVIAGCLQTMAVRLQRIMRALADKLNKG
jgi:hypothetical protein